MTSENKRLALERHRERAERFPVEFIIEEDDLVTVVHHELRQGESDDDYFSFHTYRIQDGDVVEEWSNDVAGSSPGGGRAVPDRVPASIGVGVPSINKALVSDFYRCVFDAHNPGAVKDFVHEEYHQHSGHLPPGPGPASRRSSGRSFPTVRSRRLTSQRCRRPSSWAKGTWSSSPLVFLNQTVRVAPTCVTCTTPIA